MRTNNERRRFLVGSVGGALGVAGWKGTTAFAQAAASPSAKSPTDEASTNFPRQAPELVSEVVGASHARLERVRELVEAYPELAKSAWDWGFGDWESPIDACSHTGRRDIAEFLMAHEARPTLFTHVMFGQLELVKAVLTAQPELRKTLGPHGLTMLHHARVGGEKAAAVAEYLATLDGTDAKATPVEKAFADSVVGEFSAADGPKLTFEMGKQGLVFRGKDSASRNLFQLPDGTLHPAGAPSVRFRFEVTDGKAHAVHLVMGGRTIQAKRVS